GVGTGYGAAPNQPQTTQPLAIGEDEPGSGFFYSVAIVEAAVYESVVAAGQIRNHYLLGGGLPAVTASPTNTSAATGTLTALPTATRPATPTPTVPPLPTSTSTATRTSTSASPTW